MANEVGPLRALVMGKSPEQHVLDSTPTQLIYLLHDVRRLVGMLEERRSGSSSGESVR